MTIKARRRTERRGEGGREERGYTEGKKNRSETA
jgi:hypothetical protein